MPRDRATARHDVSGAGVLIDAAQLAPGCRLRADVCIVGGGPVGLTVAHELARRSIDCLLVEAGPADRAARVGVRPAKAVGYPYFRPETTRAGGLGGTSWLWPSEGFRCRPLDPIDFEARPELSRRGWPFPVSELAPHYATAARLCGLPDDPATSAPWERAAAAAPLPLEPQDVTTAMVRVGPADAFRRVAERVLAARAVRVLCEARVGELQCAGSDAVRSATVDVAGWSITVEARLWVLAAGGIENARVLLCSRDRHAAGLGNHHDLVGRFFMEHLHVWSGWFEPDRSARPHLSLYREHGTDIGLALGVLTLAPAVLRRGALPNAGVFLSFDNLWRATEEGAALHSLFRAVKYRRWPLPPGTLGRARLVVSRPRTAARALMRRRQDGDTSRLGIMAMGEQLPNPRSRVTLGTRLDDQGRPIALIDWRPSTEDFVGLEGALCRVAHAVERAGLGRMTGFLHDGTTDALASGGHHQLGTTRMDTSPRTGVVDADGLVHGVRNLWVTGGSVFPTGGFTNPTLTAVAMGCRLAQHLADRATAHQPRSSASLSSVS